MQLIVVSGLSGAGKSVGLRVFEDLGFYCIDNLPAHLLPHLLADSDIAAGGRYERLAVGVDARAESADIKAFPDTIAEVKARGVSVTTLFLEADTDVILRRYSETRRAHPLGDTQTALGEAIQRERSVLEPIANIADVVLDTSHLNVHELREAIRHRLGPDRGARLRVLFRSFGFKYGVPDDVDYMFDVRCLPNPHWQPELKGLTGQDQAIADYLQASPLCADMQSSIIGFLDRWLPEFEQQDRSYVTVGIGCTGGRHRSVYLTEQLAAHYRDRYPEVLVRHSELT